MASCSLFLKLSLVSQIICMLAWPQIPWFGYTNCKKSLSTQIISQLSQVFCGILQSCRLRCCAFKLFLLFEELFDAKVLLIGHSVTQNYVFVVCQSAATKNNSKDWLIRHVKKTIVMKIIMHFRTNFNYMAYTSDCLIEICNTHTTTFG